MCMYFHIQEHLFPWRVRVFLKANITTSWPNACTSLHKCMCSFRISACTPYICACTSLYMFMYFFVYVHVAFDVSMQTFGVVSIASVVPAHLFLGVGVCACPLWCKCLLFLPNLYTLLLREWACLFWQTRPFSRICAFFLFMKDALFIVLHDIYIGSTLFEKGAWCVALRRKE